MHIKNHLSKLTLGQESTPPLMTGSNKILAAKIWRALTEIYDTKFTRKHGETPSESWLAAVSKLTTEQVQYGLQCAFEKSVSDYRLDGVSWPPSLPEFIAMCTPPDPPPRLPEYKMLTAPRPSKEKASEFLKKIRGVLS